MAPHEMNADAPDVRVLSAWMGLQMYVDLDATARKLRRLPRPWPSPWGTDSWVGQVWNTQDALMAVEP